MNGGERKRTIEKKVVIEEKVVYIYIYETKREAKSEGMKKKAFLVEVGVGHGTYQDRRGAGGGGQRCWSCP